MGPKQTCTCGAQKKKREVKLAGMKQGSLLRESYYGHRYIVAQVSEGLFLLVSLETGNRWNNGPYSLTQLSVMAKLDGFKVIKTNAE